MDELMKQQLLYAGALPFAIAAAALIVIGGLWRESTRKAAPAIATVIGLLAAILASRYMLDGWPNVSWERLSFGIAAAGAVAIVWSLLPRGMWVSFIAVLLGAVVCAFAAQGVFIDSDPTWSRFVPFIATAIVVLLVEPLLAKSAALPTPAVTLALGLWLAPTIGVIILSGNRVVSMPIAATASALLAVFVLSIWRRGVTLARGPMLIVVSAVHLTLIAAWLGSYELTPPFKPAFLLATFAPLGLWLGSIPPIAKRPWLAISATILGPAACGFAALALAISGSDLSAYS